MAFADGRAFRNRGGLRLLYERTVVGGVVGGLLQSQSGFWQRLAKFHGRTRRDRASCIFIAGGAGMMIGYAMINPGDLTRAQALKKKGIEAARIVIGARVFWSSRELSKVFCRRRICRLGQDRQRAF